jgi:hypothetical protein
MKVLSKIKRHAIRIKNTYGQYSFINRTEGAKYSVIMLAGHKPDLWERVFYRLGKYTPKEYDVLIITAGGDNPVVRGICDKNNWSYLSVQRNNVCLAQNIACKLLESEYVFKFDEDMFVTKNFYAQLVRTYEHVVDSGKYKVGFVAPLIPINGYGYRRLLEKFNMLATFERKFGYSYITGGTAREDDFTKDLRVPDFFWKEFPETSDIDLLDKSLSEEDFTFSICPIRFSIGAILFKRSLIEDMDYLRVTSGNGVSIDEIELCKYMNQHSLNVVVSENTAVGHLCYGPQTNAIMDYYKENAEKF